MWSSSLHEVKHLMLKSGHIMHESSSYFNSLHGHLQLGSFQLARMLTSHALMCQVVLGLQLQVSCHIELLPSCTPHRAHQKFAENVQPWAKTSLDFGKIVAGHFKLLNDSEPCVIQPITQDKQSSEVNISQKMMTLAANTVCKIAFGDSFLPSEIEHTRSEELMHEAFSLLQSFCASDFFPCVGWIADRLTGFHNKLERSFHDFDVFYQRVIDQHKDRKRTEDEEDMVDMLLRIMREQSDASFRLTEDHIKSIIMNVLVGGVDSSAITTTWAMAELSRNTRVMKKVQDEIRTHMGDKGRVFESDLEQFQYFKMVVKETLRLHPPGVLLIPRETMSHFKINGYDVCPKTLVMVNAWAIGRDGNTWEKPEEFNPERFEDSPVDYKGQHFELLPFGAGRRICPGISLGTTMVELALANLLYSYDWKLPSGMKEEEMDMEEAPGIAVRKKLPLKLVPLSYNWHKA